MQERKTQFRCKICKNEDKGKESIWHGTEQKNLAATVNPILRKHGVKTAAVFGSVAHREATAKSDIDFLVEYEDWASMLDAIRLRSELETVLGCPVGSDCQKLCSPDNGRRSLFSDHTDNGVKNK